MQLVTTFVFFFSIEKKSILVKIFPLRRLAMGKKIVETLSIHSSRVALRARPLVKKSLLPPCFRDRPPPLHLDSIRPRAPIANKGLRRVGKERQQSFASCAIPNVSPPISVSAARLVLCSKRRGLRTNKG